MTWITGKDGMPENPNADPTCDLCKGHGVCDAGYQYACVLVDCPKCIEKKTFDEVKQEWVGGHES